MASLTPPHPAPARILAVDDDPGMLRAVSRMFRPPFVVESAPDGHSALAAAASFQPDVAIVDVRMPEMSGLELMRRLHSVVPDVDVILMTGNIEDPDAHLVEAMDAGAFYFVQKPFERRVLLALVGRCLELRRLRREKQQYAERLKTELEEARQFQTSLLPPPQASICGVSIAARHVACGELAGDFYDYAESDGNVALLIADVVGHGASAAMLTAVIKSAFQAARVEGFSPLAVIARVKEGIKAFEAGRFVTLTCARLETARGEKAPRRLVYANAGHPPALLRRPGSKPVWLDSTGPLISSALVDVPCEEAVVELQPGDVVLFYTDGISEAQGPSGGMFGEAQLSALLGRSNCKAAQFLDEVLLAVSEHSAGRPLADDITMLAAEVA